MAVGDRVLGKNAYVAFKGTAMQADYRTLDINHMIDLVDISAGSEAAKSYETALKDGDAKLTLGYTASGTAGTPVYANNLVVGTKGTFTWGHEGTTAGNPKGEVVAIVKDVSDTIKYDDIITFAVTFQFSGDLTSNPRTDTW